MLFGTIQIRPHLPDHPEVVALRGMRDRCPTLSVVYRVMP